MKKKYYSWIIFILCTFFVPEISLTQENVKTSLLNSDTRIQLMRNGICSISFDNGRTWRSCCNKENYLIRLHKNGQDFVSHDKGDSWVKEQKSSIGQIIMKKNNKKYISFDMGTKWNEINTDERSDKNTFEIFPNPASDKLIVNFTNSTNTVVNLYLYDLQGNMVLPRTVLANAQEKEINLFSLCSGMYLLRVDFETSTYSKIVQVIR